MIKSCVYYLNIAMHPANRFAIDLSLLSSTDRRRFKFGPQLNLDAFAMSWNTGQKVDILTMRTPEPRRLPYKAMAAPSLAQVGLFTEQRSTHPINSPPNSSSPQQCITYFPSSLPYPSSAPFPYRNIILL